MKELKPINQPKLFGLSNFFLELVHLYDNRKLPNKILLSGQKGQGKSTLAYHLINYILSKGEKFEYDLDKKEEACQDFKKADELGDKAAHKEAQKYCK